MRRLKAYAAALTTALLPSLLAVTPAAAHHPMGGETPTTLWHGLLSGLGHPVIGPDHLAFIIAIGMAAGLVGNGGLGLAATFIAASSAGVLLYVAKLGVPMAEPLVAVSVIIAGALLFIQAEKRQPVWLGLAAAAGVLHGYAFGEAVVGAERGVIGAYLVGIAIITTAIAWSFQVLTQRLGSIGADNARLVRVTGGVLSLAGFALLALSFSIA